MMEIKLQAICFYIPFLLHLSNGVFDGQGQANKVDGKLDFSHLFNIAPSMKNLDLKSTMTLLHEVNVSEHCLEDIDLAAQALMDYMMASVFESTCWKNDTYCQKLVYKMKFESGWVINQLDAMGKPPPGILKTNLWWIGDFDECVNVRSPKRGYYKTKYIYALLPLSNPFSPSPVSSTTVLPINGTSDINPVPCPSSLIQLSPFLRYALCVPESCTKYDLNKILAAVTNNITCGTIEVENDYSMDLKATIVGAFLLVFAIISALGTAIDCANRYQTKNKLKNEEYLIVKVFLSFSIYTNGCKIVDTSTKIGQINCLNGLRSISMFWIIICHTYEAVPATTNVMDTLKLKDQIFTLTITNGSYSVDTFFVLSGLLLSFIWLKDMHRSQKSKFYSINNWIMYYVHRLIRLSPTYYIVLAAYISLTKYFMSGPFWLQTGVSDQSDCEKYWWTNVLYINNIIREDTKATSLCMPQSWYLPNDMQFYCLAPIILAMLLFFPILGCIFSVVVICFSVAINAWTVIHFYLPAANIFKEPLDERMTYGEANYELMYVAPWIRVPPYIMGIMLGYMFHRIHTWRIPKLVQILGWFISSVCALSVLYGLYYSISNQILLPLGVRALYSSMARVAWAVAICWVIAACHYQCGGVIDEFLSWRGWIPLSRLTYSVYLIHVMIEYPLLTSNQQWLRWNGHFNWLTTYSVSLLFVSYFVAFWVSCIFELPIMSLEAIFIPRSRNSAPNQQNTMELVNNWDLKEPMSLTPSDSHQDTFKTDENKRGNEYVHEPF